MGPIDPMGHNDSIRTWQLGLPPICHLLSPLPRASFPSASYGFGLRSSPRLPSASALDCFCRALPGYLSLDLSHVSLGLGPSQPRLQSASSLRLDTRLPPRPRTTLALPLVLGLSSQHQAPLGTRLLPQPRTTSVPVGLCPGLGLEPQPQPRPRSASSLVGLDLGPSRTRPRSASASVGLIFGRPWIQLASASAPSTELPSALGCPLDLVDPLL